MTDELVQRRPRSFAFGPFVLVPERQLLLKDEAPVRIGGRALDLLTVLVERPGELVSKRELLSRAWPSTVVEEANLKVNMAALRRVLGEGSGAEPYIATVVGRGYRFVAPVQFSYAAGPLADTAAASSPGHNLPVGIVRIVGRADAIDAVGRELAESRLVSIVGPGGIGKTTVALAVAERAVGSCRNGVWLVDLAPLKDPSLVPNAVATAVGLAAHSANMLATLCAFLRGREMLLVLDSCEHLVESAAVCASRILADVEGVKILATSREPLRVKGERVRRLAALGTPPQTRGLTADEALRFPAIELFVDRATQRLESFRLDDAGAPVVAQICRRLDGLALAIELAATRVDAFDVVELLAQLDDRLGLLAGHRGGVERHRTLAATIDWSYALLSDSERTIMRRLAIFAGGFSLASACAVADGEGLSRAQVVEDVASLVAKSLLATEPRDVGMEYRLLDTTRAYVLERLAVAGETADARLRHARHLLDLARQAGADAGALPRDEWLGRYAARIDDLRSALAWTFDGMADVALGLALTVAAIPFWEQLSLLEECRVAVALALKRRFDAHRDERQARALWLALGASLLYTRGPLPEVKSALTKALEIAERTNDAGSQLECLRGLSEYELWSGNTRAALSASDAMRSIAAASGDAKAVENADAQAGSALRYLGDLAASQRHLERIVEHPPCRGWRSAASRFEFDQHLAARGSLASVLWLRGFPDQAVAMAARQREEAEASHHAVPLCSAIIHTTVGIALFVGDLDDADRLLRFIEHYATEHRLTVWRAMATCMRGRWLLDRGEPFQLVPFREAVAELYDHGLRMRYPSYLANLGEGLAQLGDIDGAHASIDRALALSQSSGQVWGMSEILRMKGNLLRLEGKPGSLHDAADRYAESLRWAREQGALSWELRTAVSLVELWREAGGNAQAEAILSDAWRRFEEGYETRDLRRARTLLTDIGSGP
ncbi:ATP-binding protein [Tahibacter soli]|uniref:Helix-turn-helix transcriptional regulator n=1 Tax=Tahibacter soli TaxID=2983605 RepID=A0A9X4BLG0_9GAMM|nr:helix-turn-helix transcriptional regulator [Tahibacter soli]MDC8015297.1 helix-turn-helix transcriptional regulator [Tahibacter soli]